MKKIKAIQIPVLFLLILRSSELLAVPEYILLDFAKFNAEEDAYRKPEMPLSLDRWSTHSKESSISDGQDWLSRSAVQRSKVIEYKFDYLEVSFIPFHFKGESSYANINRLIDRKLSSRYFDKVFLIIKNEIKNGDKEFKILVEEEWGDEIELLTYSAKETENERSASQCERSVLSLYSIEDIISRINDKTLLLYVDNIKWNLTNFQKRLDLTNSLRESDFED
ncbi:MAG: hypothetical protein AB8G05_17635 [Oligoflexales bacterium]